MNDLDEAIYARRAERMFSGFGLTEMVMEPRLRERSEVDEIHQPGWLAIHLDYFERMKRLFVGWRYGGST